MLQPPIERAPREPERLGGLAHLAAGTRQRTLDQVALGLLDRHLLQARRAIGVGRTEQQVLDLDALCLREQERTLHHVLELPHVAGPGVLEQRARGLRREGPYWLALTRRE